MLFFRSDDSVFRLAANYVMTLFEDSAHSDSTNTNSETETVPLRPTTMAYPRYYSYGSIRQTQTQRQSGPTRNHTVWWHNNTVYLYLGCQKTSQTLQNV